jgi:two-component system, NtrC family, response regulator HydG
MTTAMIPSTLVPNHAPSCDAAALLNVLIVDDDQPAREACREATAALACRTTVTDSVEQALWLVALHEIDVVLLGLKLSDAARLQILRQIKQKRSDVELVIMATNTAARPAVEAIRAGACDYLTKPFGLEELRLSLERVARQLQSRIATQQLSEKSSPTALVA